MERIAGVSARGGTVLHAEKTVGYHYEAPVREVVTRLRMFPHARHGRQHLVHQEVQVWPEPTTVRIYRDVFGNEVREYAHATIEQRLEFGIRLWTEHRPLPRRTGLRVPGLHGVPATGVNAFLGFSDLIDLSEEMEETAREFAAGVPAPRGRAEAISRWVYGTMRFQSGVTSVDTPASAALAGRTGVCQDYTHIMLALCRATGIPARYASGFIPGEGYMHAWVEVLASEPDGRSAHWIGFDPTHNRPTDAQYLTVAVGRDYTDISPISGSYYGAARGRLHTWSRTLTQSPLPALPLAGAPTGAGVSVTDRLSDRNNPVIQPGYAC